MKKIVCEMCEGSEFLKQDGMFVCQGCGMKYSVEEAKKIMVEDDVEAPVKKVNTVKVDASDELSNLYQLARRARENNNSENAAKYYDMVLVKDPNSWEANFYSVYYESMSCKIAQIQSAAIKVNNCEDTVLSLIKDSITDPDELYKAIDTICADLIEISNMLFYAAKNHYDGINYQIKNNYQQEYLNNCCAARDILYNFGDYVIQYFGDIYGASIAAPCWKVAINQHKILLPSFKNKDININNINSYVNKIKKYDPNYVAPELTTGGCYVATAVYGSYDCPQVWTLRRYRDNSLATTWYGRAFIKTYYAISPTLVKWFGDSNWFKKMWRGTLDRMVKNLQDNGVESTPYDDKNW